MSRPRNASSDGLASASRAAFPSSLGEFQIRELLAHGSAGVVFLGEDAGGRRVAIKLAEQLSPAALRRFQHEIAACRRLDHPDVVRILGSGVHEGHPWYAMDYHGRVTLRDLLQANAEGVDNELPTLVAAIARGRLRRRTDRPRLLPQTAAISLIMGVGRAVAHAHARGLVHRDLKPENVLVREDGRPVVCDFGLVKDLAAATAQTATGRFLGTLGYQAPEQREGGKAVDERVDVFALGVMLGEILTGQPPRPDPVVAPGTRLQIAGQMRLGRDLQLVIQRATHPDPMRRYHSVQALVSDLERQQRGERVRARPDPWWLRLHGWGLRHRLTAVLLIVASALTATATLTAWIMQRLGTAQWDLLLVESRLGRPEDLDSLLTVSGRWRSGENGARRVGGGLGDAVLLHPIPRAEAVRLSATILPPVEAAPLGVGLMLAATDAHSGYCWRVGYRGCELSLLSRDGQVLWLGREQLRPGRRHQLELECADGIVSARLDGREVFAVADPAPLPNGRCGVLVEEGADEAAPVLAGLILHGCSVPESEVPDALPRRVLAVTRRLDHASRQELWPHATVLGRDLAGRDPAFAAALAASDPRPPTPPEGAVAGDAAELARLWPLLGAKAARRALEHLWLAQPDQRRAVLLWAVGEDGTSAEGANAPALLLQVAKDAPDIGKPERWLLAHRALRRAAWHDADSDAAAHLLLAERDQAKGLARPALIWQRWMQLLPADTSLGTDSSTEPTEPLVATALMERLRLFDPVRVLDAVGPTEELALVGPPTQDLTLEPYQELPSRAERLLLARLDRDHIPPAAWAVPQLERLVLRRTLQGCLAGTHDPAELTSGPWPWPRLALAALLVNPEGTGQRRDVARHLSDMGVELWAAGLVWRWAHHQPMRPDECLAYGPGPRAVLAALADPGLLPTTTVPVWHPSRPTLELLLALHARRSGMVEEAERRLRALAAQPGWVEAVAAEWALAQ